MNDSSNTASAVVDGSVAAIGLGNGGNTASASPKGWQGTVHNLTAADKASNFRKSLDRERAAAHPQAAATGAAILGATVDGALRINALAPPDEHTIKPFADLKKPDRQGEWEDRFTRIEAELARLRHFEGEAQSPFREVFVVAQDGSNRAQWKEQTVQDADLVEFQDGRKCLSSSASGQLITLDDKKAVLEVRAGSARAYVDLTSGRPCIVQVLDVVGMGRGFYHCQVVNQISDVDPTLNFDDVVATIFDTPLSDANQILINLMQYFGPNDPALAVNGYYPAFRIKPNADGREVFVTWGHTYFALEVLSGCPTVGMDGVSLEFGRLLLNVMGSGTATACVLPGTNCAGT